MNSFVLPKIVAMLYNKCGMLSSTFFYDGIRTLERMTSLRKDPSQDAFQVKMLYHNLFLSQCLSYFYRIEIMLRLSDFRFSFQLNSFKVGDHHTILENVWVFKVCYKYWLCYVLFV